jgi:hypothetical protein
MLSFRIERELTLKITALRQVEQDGRCLEHNEIIARAVNEHGYSSIGIHGEEPGLLLRVFGYVDFMRAKGSP